jgi:hypothetical protein
MLYGGYQLLKSRVPEFHLTQFAPLRQSGLDKLRVGRGEPDGVSLDG